MSSFYSLTKSLKACLFTTVLYGWLIPTVWIADHLNEWLPSRQLTSTDWIIEAGAPNTSWDLVTIDGVDVVDAPTEELQNQGQDHTHSTLNAKDNPSRYTQPKSESEEANETEELIGTKSDDGMVNVSPKSRLIAKPHRVKGLSNHSTKSFTNQKRTVRKGKCDVENPNIKKAGKNAYTLPKSTLNHYSTHWKEASRLAHLSWAMKKDGSRLGIRIRGISCRSPLKFAGLRHGDVVLTINDHSVQSEKDLLKVYSRLLFWKKVDVKVKRGDRTLTLKYDIT